MYVMVNGSTAAAGITGIKNITNIPRFQLTHMYTVCRSNFFYKIEIWTQYFHESSPNIYF